MSYRKSECQYIWDTYVIYSGDEKNILLNTTKYLFMVRKILMESELVNITIINYKLHNLVTRLHIYVF